MSPQYILFWENTECVCMIKSDSVNCIMQPSYEWQYIDDHDNMAVVVEQKGDRNKSLMQNENNNTVCRKW